MQVTGIVRHDVPSTVYNFVVEETHTYFVGTANGGMWVHNGPCGKVFVKTEEEAGEYFYKNFFQNEEGTVWHNSTGMNPVEANETFTGSGQAHYHWDGPHPGETPSAPHLQFHFDNGDKLKIFYNVPN